MPFHWRTSQGGFVGQVVMPCGNQYRGLAVAFLALLTVLLSACAANRGIPPDEAGAPGAEPAYSCSDIKVDAVIKQDLRRNVRAYGWDTPVSELHPHLKSIATKIADATRGKRLSDKQCKIVSTQTLYVEKFFTRVEHPIHYIVELKTPDANRVSEICVTRNRYSVDSGITQQDLDRWAKEKREAPAGLIFRAPTSTTNCFMTDELTGNLTHR